VSASGWDAHTCGEFLAELRNAGADCDRIEPDGGWHRARAKDDHRGTPFWYKCFPDGGAVYGNWRSGDKRIWHPDSARLFSPAERERMRAAWARASRLRDAEQARQHREAQGRARELWGQAALPNPDHVYLVRKQVIAIGIRQFDENLVVPLRDCVGELWSVQFIAPSGEKRFLAGGRTKGLYCPVGKGPVTGQLLISEGWATAASLHMATGFPVAAALSANNLEPVGRSMREKYPSAKITICGDNDWQTQERTGENPGIHCATRAARAIGAYVTWPEFANG
jgi:putative DNA primase/helicase